MWGVLAQSGLSKTSGVQHAVDCRYRYEQSSPKPDGWQLAAVGELERGASRNTKDFRRLFDIDRHTFGVHYTASLQRVLDLSPIRLHNIIEYILMQARFVSQSVWRIPWQRGLKRQRPKIMKAMAG
jgi:hypothetical protein